MGVAVDSGGVDSEQEQSGSRNNPVYKILFSLFIMTHWKVMVQSLLIAHWNQPESGRQQQWPLFHQEIRAEG